MSESLDIAEKLLEGLPYTDGSGRRRLVVGVLFLAGLSVTESDWWSPGLGTVFASVTLLDILKSPILILVLFVLAYALGNLIELLGDTLFHAFARVKKSELDLESLVSTDKQKILLSVSKEGAEFTGPVIEGLRHPLGPRSELAFKCVADAWVSIADGGRGGQSLAQRMCLRS